MLDKRMALTLDRACLAFFVVIMSKSAFNKEREHVIYQDTPLAIL